MDQTLASLHVLQSYHNQGKTAAAEAILMDNDSTMMLLD